jgi:hypothetical protein
VLRPRPSVSPISSSCLSRRRARREQLSYPRGAGAPAGLGKQPVQVRRQDYIAVDGKRVLVVTATVSAVVPWIQAVYSGRTRGSYPLLLLPAVARRVLGHGEDARGEEPATGTQVYRYSERPELWKDTAAITLEVCPNTTRTARIPTATGIGCLTSSPSSSSSSMTPSSGRSSPKATHCPATGTALPTASGTGSAP